MRLRSFFSITILLLFGQSQAAVEQQNPQYESIEELRAAVRLFASGSLKNDLGEEKFLDDVKIKVSRLDSRLKLPRCDKGFSFSMLKAAQRSRSITVKTSCESPRPWSIFVPVSVEIYGDVVVASRNLRRGTILQKEDLQLKRLNTSSMSLGLVQDKSRLVGMELRRAINSGQHFLFSSVEAAKIIEKGDSVILEARSTTVSVATKGTALAHGKLGERIRVRNNQSDRVVDGTVLGPGRVAVAF